MKLKTTKHRRHTKQNILQVRVMSPRIAWFRFLKITGTLAKIACVLAVITGIGYGIWRGIEHAFYKNPDFRLQVIDLNTNSAIDALGVTTMAGIDLTKNPSLFEVDVKKVAETLRKMPSISEARVERHLPGTLVVRVIPRFPKAWISHPGSNPSDVRKAGSMLVDGNAVAYPCSETQLESAVTLPIIELPALAEQAIKAGEKIQCPELDYCFLLLDSAHEADPDASRWIESMRQANDWSLLLVTRQGTSATFALGDHDRQMERLRAALDHAADKGYNIDTINLIPKYNIPITLRGEAPAPKAIPVPAASTADDSTNRRNQDLNNLLRRN
ncbi:MAG: FtsQ-type POTRA domain-containing protein [Gloeobacteraceae cyanobacterium ES-bin-144]|nr:FtsQ-type POTRA domain-containing protein [Verrucomicrobiales bacterium]